MLGLIKKDLLMIKGNIKFFAVLIVVYGLFAFQGETNFTAFLPFMSVVLMLSTFSYDGYNKWDTYVSTLPDGRKNSVRAKYLSTLILITITMTITFIFTIAISYVRSGRLDMENILPLITGTAFSTILLFSFMYPAIYKFGIEKARIGIFVIVFGIVIILGILSKIVNFEPAFRVVENLLENYFVIILPAVIIVILLISIKISEKIYKNKEY